MPRVAKRLGTLRGNRLGARGRGAGRRALSLPVQPNPLALHQCGRFRRCTVLR